MEESKDKIERYEKYLLAAQQLIQRYFPEPITFPKIREMIEAEANTSVTFEEPNFDTHPVDSGFEFRAPCSGIYNFNIKDGNTNVTLIQKSNTPSSVFPNRYSVKAKSGYQHKIELRGDDYLRIDEDET